MPERRRPIRFADLFAGLGGFHVGLTTAPGVDARCVFACELDPQLRDLYETNFEQPCHGDIREIDEREIPRHDVLCAGFPCQPFSKAGEQRGLGCEENGDLFEDHLLRIIEHHQPSYLLLENVPNLERHDGGRTWEHMRALLESDALGYDVDWKILSPHEFGVPQVRQRMYIVASRKREKLSRFDWPRPSSHKPSIYDVLDDEPEGARELPQHYVEAIDVWNEFLRKFPRRVKLPSFPIWGMEFGATYPFQGTTPSRCPLSELQSSRGVLGRRLAGLTRREAFQHLPSYAHQERFPRWKQTFIRQNRELYQDNRSWIDGWKRQLRCFSPSLQKLEWNCKGEVRDIWQHIVQIRASGIRVKRDSSAPALVAMTTTQVPVIASQRRFMTVRECAAIQGLHSLAELPPQSGRAFRALGNAVNAEIVRRISTRLLVPGRKRPQQKQIALFS